MTYSRDPRHFAFHAHRGLSTAAERVAATDVINYIEMVREAARLLMDAHRVTAPPDANYGRVLMNFDEGEYTPLSPRWDIMCLQYVMNLHDVRTQFGVEKADVSGQPDKACVVAVHPRASPFLQSLVEMSGRYVDGEDFVVMPIYGHSRGKSIGGHKLKSDVWTLLPTAVLVTSLCEGDVHRTRNTRTGFTAMVRPLLYPEAIERHNAMTMALGGIPGVDGLIRSTLVNVGPEVSAVSEFSFLYAMPDTDRSAILAPDDGSTLREATR